MTTRDTDWDGVRLHVVTGKGGTGKTTVAAALALALAHGGRKVLLIETEGRQGIAQLFDRPPLPYGERKIAIGPGEQDDGRDPGGDVYALAIDPEGALLDYLHMFYNMRSAGIALTKLGLVDFATTIAPGLSDVLVTGKATEATRRKKSGGFIPGIRPGRPTAEYLQFVLSRITLPGSIYLAIIAVLPNFFFSMTGGNNQNFPFGGTAVLILVGVALDTVKQIESQLMQRNYEGFLR